MAYIALGKGAVQLSRLGSLAGVRRPDADKREPGKRTIIEVPSATGLTESAWACVQVPGTLC